MNGQPLRADRFEAGVPKSDQLLINRNPLLCMVIWTETP